MAFVLAPSETPGAGLERVIAEQVAKLSAECIDAGEYASAFAHKARVRAKRVRAALRLARPLMGGKTFRHENKWWRDAGRLLSELRDAGARLEALETLRPVLVARIGTAMTRKLTERFESEKHEIDAATAIAKFRKMLDERRDDLAPKLDAGDRGAAIEAMGDTYREARRTMAVALETEDPLLLHEWRKQAKYHALQARLMRLTFPEVLDGRVADVRALAERLGEVQDIEIVAEGAKSWAEAPANFSGVLAMRRKLLVGEARGAGEKLFSDKPKAWMRQLAPAETADL